MIMHFNRPDIIRPPSERESYFLPLTKGCSNNTCIFCNYYDSKLQIRDLDEVKEEIDALALYVEHGICLPDIPDVVYYIARQWDGKEVFLQDGDALVYPFPKLIEALQYLNDKLPGLRRIATYATAQDILRRSAVELDELRKLKLSIFYMGVESGDDELLKRIHKGANHNQLVEAGKKAKEARIVLSVTVILGLGGVEGSERHALETARILSEIDPDYAGALTLTLVPNTPLYHEWKQGSFTLVSPLESLTELLKIVENSSFTNCFFSSMHASNYFSIRGKLPQDKARIVGELKHVLAQGDLSLLRPEVIRGL
ncbi:radical SAM protein [Chloroflexota bacterium]